MNVYETGILYLVVALVFYVIGYISQRIYKKKRMIHILIQFYIIIGYILTMWTFLMSILNWLNITDLSWKFIILPFTGYLGLSLVFGMILWIRLSIKNFKK